MSILAVAFWVLLFMMLVAELLRYWGAQASAPSAGDRAFALLVFLLFLLVGVALFANAFVVR